MSAPGSDPEGLGDRQAFALALAARLDAARQAELERTLRRLRHLDAADRDHVEQLSRQIVSAIIGDPLERLHRGRHFQAARELFEPV